MKNLFLLFAFTFCLGFVNAQNAQTTTTTTTTTKPAAKEQAKPAAKPMDTAKPAAKPAEAAKPMDSKMADMNTKEHVCTKACKDGKHVYAHGEKGHVCTDAEKKAMGKKSRKAKKMSSTAPAEKKS